MPFSVIIATFGFMLNAIGLTHKHTSFYKKAQQSGTVQIYKSKELESTFVEVLEPGMSKNNMIIGCIYRHHSMELSEFNNHFLSVLLEKISKENKMVVLLGDFNADLLKYDHDEEVSGFLDAMYSKLLLPNISSPKRITSTSATNR